jgi:hypothetical protein
MEEVKSTKWTTFHYLVLAGSASLTLGTLGYLTYYLSNTKALPKFDPKLTFVSWDLSQKEKEKVARKWMEKYVQKYLKKKNKDTNVSQ